MLAVSHAQEARSGGKALITWPPHSLLIFVTQHPKAYTVVYGNENQWGVKAFAVGADDGGTSSAAAASSSAGKGDPVTFTFVD